MAEAMPKLAKTFAVQPLNNRSDLTASKEILSAAKTLVDALDGIVAKTRAKD